MPSLNLDLNYFDHRKTVRLAGLLGMGSEVLPLRVWCYCGRHHAGDGRLTGYSPQEVETIAKWWGEKGKGIDALIRVGFLDVIPPAEGGGYAVHDWHEHGRHFSVYHARAKQAAASRWGDASSNASSIPSSNAKAVPKQCQGSAVQRNAETPQPPVGGVELIPIPGELQTEAFARAWAEWQDFRRQKRQKLTLSSAGKQLAMLAKWGPEQAVSAIEASITAGWTGLFQPKAATARQSDAKAEMLRHIERIAGGGL